MLPSGKLPRFAIAVSGVLTAVLIFVVVAIRTPATSLLYSDLTQTAIVLWAGSCALYVALRSSCYLRWLWSLLAIAILISGAAQALETYYENVAHLVAAGPWPSDILFILWVMPAVLMLLPRTASESGSMRWQGILDFAQLGVVALTAYLYFFYVTSRWDAEGQHMIVQIMRLQASRDLALAAGCLMGARAIQPDSVRAFFRGMSVLFLLSSVSSLVYVLGWLPPVGRANWIDVLWCLPYLFATVFASTWNRYEEPAESKQDFTPQRLVVSHFLPVCIPLLVLLMARRIAAEQMTIAWMAITASFLFSAARLILTNQEQRRIANELRVSEERFRTLLENVNVGVILQRPDTTVEFANHAALRMFGVTEEEVFGKKVTELALIPVNEDGSVIPFELRPTPRAVAAKQMVRFEVIGWKKPNTEEILWLMGEVVPLFDARGEVERLIGSFIDITKRRQAEEALHQLSTRLLRLQDEERRRLGRELHDSLAQSVMAVNLDLAQVGRSAVLLDERTKRALSEARNVLREMSREIRTLSYLLHPPVLDELGLTSAIEEYAKGFGERSGIDLEADLQADFGRLPQETETALFRIVQESLANIQRHSRSKTARIALREDRGCVELEISDEGCGMDRMMLERGNRAPLGVGILGMRERMAQLGGRLEVESSSSGTTVRATIPLAAEVVHAPTHTRGG